MPSRKFIFLDELRLGTGISPRLELNVDSIYDGIVASRQAVASRITWEDHPPETSVIREVMAMFKTALEIALVLLKVFREIFGLLRDIKHPRRPDQR